MPKNNALAELAFRIDAAHTDMIACEVPKQYCEYVKTAQRIVAELAKVNRDHFDRPMIGSSINVVNRCRAIAEEGA